MVKLNKIVKDMFSIGNLIFIGVAVVSSILIMNIYSKLVQTVLPMWVSFTILITVTIFGIFVSGWLLRLRRKNMPHIEFYLTVALIILIMLSLNKYYPEWLYGANIFVEPAREVLTEGARNFLAQ